MRLFKCAETYIEETFSGHQTTLFYFLCNEEENGFTPRFFCYVAS